MKRDQVSLQTIYLVLARLAIFSKDLVRVRPSPYSEARRSGVMATFPSATSFEIPRFEANRSPSAALVESWAGEVRVNLIRLAGIIAFYANHLINVYRSPNDPSIAGDYHAKVTALAAV